MNTSGPLANGLYPIIRRARRPFIIAESVPDGPTAPSPVVALPNAEGIAPVETPKPQGEADMKRKKSRDDSNNI